MRALIARALANVLLDGCSEPNGPEFYRTRCYFGLAASHFGFSIGVEQILRHPIGQTEARQARSDGQRVWPQGFCFVQPIRSPEFSELALLSSPSSHLEQEPRTTFRLVDPVLDQAS